jgi:hypothetical protein
MTHNIIKTDNYLLIVSDEEIKIGNYYLCKLSMKPKKYIGDEYCNTVNEKKITAHITLNNSPVLEGVPLLPPLEDEVRELAQKQWGNVHRSGVLGFIEGYNKAKEKHKYTEEDLTRAFNIGINSQFESTELKLNKDESFDRHSKNLLKLIQSLRQPKMPVAFECEDEYVHDDTVPYPKTLGTHPKTIVNPQGQTVLVGKYIY